MLDLSENKIYQRCIDIELSGNLVYRFNYTFVCVNVLLDNVILVLYLQKTIVPRAYTHTEDGGRCAVGPVQVNAYYVGQDTVSH